MIVLAASLAVVASLYGKVEVADVVILTGTLSALALGLVPFAITLMQMRVFYAMKDARTPALINLVMVVVRIPLLIASVALSPVLVVPAMALGTTVSYVVGAVVGEMWLRHRYGPMGTARTLITLGKMVLASAIGGLVAFGIGQLTTQGPVDTLSEALIRIVVCAPIGLLVIGVLALLLRVEELDPLRRRLAARLPGRAGRRAGAVTTGRDAPAGSGGHGNPVASTRVRNDGHGTLVGADPSVAGAAPTAAARPTGAAGPSSSSTSREQVSATVSENRSAGPAVDGGSGTDARPEDPEATTEVRRSDLDAATASPSDRTESIDITGATDSGPAPVAADATATPAVDPSGSADSPLKPGMMVGGRTGWST